MNSIPEMKLYVFSFMSRTDGVIGSLLPEGETLAKIEAEMKETFGEDGFSVIEFRPATDEETIEIQNQIMPGDDVDMAPASATIN